MAILINMEMPVSCDECPCSNRSQEDILYCMVEVEPITVKQWNGKPLWCPMVEVDAAWYSHHPQKNIYGG